MRIAKYFDNFVAKCPYFNGDSDVNNGYGCNHENQDEMENGQGKCYCWSCPLGYPADEESLEENDIEWEDGKPEADEMEEDAYIILNDDFQNRKGSNDYDKKSKISNLMIGRYEPSLADSIRIYKEYCGNKGEIASILSEIYTWLSQEPLMVHYKNGTIYARCECDTDTVLCVHFIYVNKTQNIIMDEKFACEDVDITEVSLRNHIQYIKQLIREKLN